MHSAERFRRTVLHGIPTLGETSSSGFGFRVGVPGMRSRNASRNAEFWVSRAFPFRVPRSVETHPAMPSQIPLREQACGTFEVRGQTEFLQVDLALHTRVMEGDQGEGGGGGGSSSSGSSGSLVPMIAAASSDTAGMLAGQVEPAPHALQSAY